MRVLVLLVLKWAELEAPCSPPTPPLKALHLHSRPGTKHWAGLAWRDVYHTKATIKGRWYLTAPLSSGFPQLTVASMGGLSYPFSFNGRTFSSSCLPALPSPLMHLSVQIRRLYLRFHSQINFSPRSVMAFEVVRRIEGVFLGGVFWERS